MAEMNTNVKIKKSKTKMSDKTFNVILTTIATIILIIFLYPMIFVVSSSFSSGEAVTAGAVVLWPVDFSLEGYKWILRNNIIYLGYRNSITYVVLGTLLHLFMCVFMSYPLSRRDYQGKRAFQIFLILSMMFGGGLIPTYILVSSLGLVNNPLWMILSGAVSIGNSIMMRTFFQSNVPYELLEAAKMDGITDIGYLFKVMLPLSKAIISVISLYAIVGKWNDYMGPLIYLRNRDYYPLQLILNEMLNEGKFDSSKMEQGANDAEKLASNIDGIRYAIILVGTIPMLILYPFVQKFFEKGVTVGTIKG